jgi:hypothetical protein
MASEAATFPHGDGDVPVNIVDSPSLQQKPNPDFNPKVFWSVNAFIAFLVCLTVVWCCFVQKYFYNEGERLNRSDEIYRERRRRRLEAKKGNGAEAPGRRRRKLHASFAKHKVQMTVKQEDLVIKPDDGASDYLEHSDIESGDTSNSNLSLDDEAGYLKLRDKTGRAVPNCCAVCLSGYSPGDTVVWSSNPSCTHAFHRECVVDWLIKMQPETPCPCCRQEFTDLEAIRQELKIQWIGNFAFDLNSVSLR